MRVRGKGPTMNHLLRGAALGLTLAGALALGACENAGPSLVTASDNVVSGASHVAQAAAPLVVVDAVSLINTDKTLIDHIAGGLSGQDCSTLRSMEGGHYCQPHYENKPVVPPLYCYRTLAKVTCYDRPSPNPADRLVGMRPGGQLPTY